MKKLFTICLAMYFLRSNAQQLNIGNGTNWRSDAATFVVLENTDFVNDAASQTLANTFKFTGNSNNYIYGSQLPIFSTITIAKTGVAKLLLNRTINSTVAINFNGGLIDLNGFNINLGSNALLVNENENSRIMGSPGYVRIIKALTAPAAANPGNLGAVITTTQDMGSTSVYRSHASQTNSSGLGNSILRYYDIIPTNNTGLNATLRINYYDAELNSLPENSLVVWKSPDNSNWSVQGYSSRDAVTNFVEKTGIADFSRWTLSSVNNTLPVNFILFNTQCNANSVVLTWKTAQEQNSSYFEVQKSMNNGIFSTIGTVLAAGNSGTEKTYSYTDRNVSTNTVFYRIAETDIDGRKQYTAINTIHCGTLYDELKVWPNPVQQTLFIHIDATDASPVVIKVFDSKGSLIRKQNSSLFRGTNVVSIDMNQPASGSYLINVEWGNGHFHKTTTIVKQ